MGSYKSNVTTYSNFTCIVLLLENIISLFLFIWKANQQKERETEVGREWWSVFSSLANACNIQFWTLPKPGASNSITISCVSDRDLSVWVPPTVFQNRHSQEAGIRESKSGIKSRHSDSECGCPKEHLSACTKWSLLICSFYVSPDLFGTKHNDKGFLMTKSLSETRQMVLKIMHVLLVS